MALASSGRQDVDTVVGGWEDASKPDAITETRNMFEAIQHLGSVQNRTGFVKSQASSPRTGSHARHRHRPPTHPRQPGPARILLASHNWGWGGGWSGSQETVVRPTLPRSTSISSRFSASSELHSWRMVLFANLPMEY